MAGFTVSSPVSVDDHCDPSVLEDVLAFVDSFDNECAETGERAGATPLSTAKAAAQRMRPQQSNASVARYWKRKKEMHIMRCTVEYLTKVLKSAKRQQRTRKLAAEQERALAIARWRKCAEDERERLRRSEATNAQLNYLMRVQMQSSRMMNAMLHSIWWGSWEHYLSCPFVGVTPSGQLEQLSSASMRAARAAVADFPNSWTTTFNLSPENLHNIGGIWRSAVQRLSLSPGCRADSFVRENRDVVRVERDISWSVPDDADEDILYSGVVTYELRKSDGLWAIMLAADAYDAAKTRLLFRTSAVRAVALTDAATSRACEFQARYSIDYSDDQRQQTGAKCARAMEMGARTWAGVMHQKDQDMRLFLGIC